MALIGANGVCADSILVAVVIISSTFIEIWFKNQLINNCSSINPPIDCQLTFFNKNKVNYIFNNTKKRLRSFLDPSWDV